MVGRTPTPPHLYLALLSADNFLHLSLDMSQHSDAPYINPNLARYFDLAPILEDHEKEQDVTLPSFQELDRWLTRSRNRDGLLGFVSPVPPPAHTPVTPPSLQIDTSSYLRSLKQIQVPVSDTYLARAYGGQSLPQPLSGVRGTHTLMFIPRWCLSGSPRCCHCDRLPQDLMGLRGLSTLPSEIPLSVMDERDGPGVPLSNVWPSQMWVRDWSYPVFSGCAMDYIVVYFYVRCDPIPRFPFRFADSRLNLVGR